MLMKMAADDSENEDSPVVPENVPDDKAESDKIDVVGENIPQSNMVLWKYPTEVSQSTLDGRNGSSACSVIALIFAHVAKRELLDLQPTPLLSPVWVMLLCSAIRLGNKLYNLCRHRDRPSPGIYARFSGKKRTSMYISWQKRDHHYIQTRHNDLFFPLPFFSSKT